MYQRSASQLYAQIDVESEIMNASPYQLIQILFNGALSALRRAIILMEQGNIAEKGAAISKAINIIDNGLKQGLDNEKGGELAHNLASLYDYMTQRLLYANLRNDEPAITEVIKLLTEISDAWRQIGPHYNASQDIV
ncbi:flagellar export chaperone FliS [Photorhabdus laumondii subsp. laumondii]|uniref:Flagellar secretion chaperone FliS n=5 Tax=Photorhabdus TaxID=29487 RepID=Q7N5J6_PHOLL|nr:MULTISPECIES: flagellar export chaperone FliS [Photorhabdus]PQQ36379.1 flagella export chaperone FliS [Photorhabdus luminescens]AWK41755.1 flagellar protein FliS [Photorhabdus laumondii subsp. laumondii]AXG42574.1 flagella export chaperone FliS [Photorhabdus laumondii subsp. laumondii]AXG47076.1 flagella export chaperone FliS [Photorhabdus laumondii subsp. laumondii]KTL60959.1 flagellar export chaperone FliS [Photorhabdus laumondii subsp. laumondii]